MHAFGTFVGNLKAFVGTNFCGNQTKIFGFVINYRDLFVQ